MATGLEVAGVVLGTIPLVLAGLQFYADGIAVTRRYVKYREEFKSLVGELRTEQTMCVNSINMLLIGVVKQKEMAAFLTDPFGDCWKDDHFDQKLKQRLGTTYDSYIVTISQMSNIIEQFKERLKLSDSGKPQFTEEKTFREHYKRLKFSLKRADYSDLMTKLRHANSALHRMTTQTISLETLQSSSRLKQSAGPNFNVINERAQGFYSALSTGWNCSCHADHSVSLRLEPRIDGGSSDDGDDEMEEPMHGPFHVIFHYGHQYLSNMNSGKAKVGPWAWEEADVRVTREALSPEKVSISSGLGRGVRFTSEARKAVKAALEPMPNMQPIQDLCAAISELQKPQREVCLSLLATEIAKQKYGILIYPPKEPPEGTDFWSVSSLRQVLDDTGFARRDRLRLAITLASSVLQLHETPWLRENWGKDSIFFIKRPDKNIYDQPFVSQHFNKGLSEPLETPMPASMTRIVRNQTLYALGVALIELWYGKSLADLHKPEDGPRGTGDARIDFMTDWNTADRLVDELYSEAGGKYSDAVRRCIRCDFDRRASSLEDVAFQKAVYQGVVAQLKENYDFLY